jgi:hypothetical protein
LPVLHVDITISPPYFDVSADMIWVSDMVEGQFHALRKISDFGLLLKMHWQHYFFIDVGFLKFWEKVM